MKSELDPVTADEWVIRCIWHFRFRQSDLITISPGAFEPRIDEMTGISVFRESCLADPESCLMAFDEKKRPGYGLVRLAVSELIKMGLKVEPDPRRPISGHALIPELTITAYQSDKSKWRMVTQSLADLAIGNVIRWPVTIQAK